MIHCFGDSHIAILSDKRPDIFISHGTKAITAYMFCELYDSMAYEFEKIPEGSNVLLSFGEIDCCLHIKKYAVRLNKSIEETIDVNISKYAEVLSKLNGRFRLAVFGVYPHQYYPDTEEDSEVTHIGTWGEVLLVKSMFNNKLRFVCEQLGIFYFSLFEESVLNKWYLPEHGFKYYKDRTHLSEYAVPLIIGILKDGGVE